MQLCWKKSCHGAIVVPTMAITRNIRSAVIPPAGIDGTSAWFTNLPNGRPQPEGDPEPGEIQQAEENHRALPTAVAAGQRPAALSAAAASGTP